MKTHFLFPNKFKIIGWILFIPAFILSILVTIERVPSWLPDINFKFFRLNLSGFKDTHFEIYHGSISEILIFCLVIGGILVGFCKLKNEDEFTSKIRYESLVWATYFNYGLVLLFSAIIYELDYLVVLSYNIFTLLLFFIIRFHYKLYQLSKTERDDE